MRKKNFGGIFYTRRRKMGGKPLSGLRSMYLYGGLSSHPPSRSSSSLLAFLRHSISSAAPPLRKDKRINMTENLGLQAASMVDEKIREFRCLQEELNTHRSDLGTLMAQRNENELVKQVGVGVHGHRSPFRFDCLISGAKTE